MRRGAVLSGCCRENGNHNQNRIIIIIIMILISISGLQKGPAERGHVKKRQKSSKSVKKFFDTFRQLSRRSKNVKNRHKVSKSFSTLFDNFRAAPFFRPFLQSADSIISLSASECQKRDFDLGGFQE